LANADEPGIEVNVLPTQPHRLTSTHAGGGDEHVGGIQRVIFDTSEELAQLSGGPRLHLGFGPLRWARRCGRIAEQYTETNAVVQRLPQRRMRVVDRLGRQRPATGGTRLHHLGIRGLELHRRELVETYMAETLDDPLQVLFVAAECRPARRRLLVGKPLLEVLTDRRRAALGTLTRLAGVKVLAKRRPGGFARGEAALAALAATSDRRISTCVSDVGPGLSPLVHVPLHRPDANSLVSIS
jgi:hypothetical protein